MAYKSRAIFDTLRSVAFGSITASYTVVGVPLTNQAVIISFINDTNANLYISLNGTSDQIYIPNNTAMIIDVHTNQPGDGLFIASGTQIWAKHDGSAPTTGLLAMQTIYAGVTD